MAWGARNLALVNAISDFRSGKGCSQTGCNGTNLEDKNTFFMEYVLERSNTKNYFTQHVAGFVLRDFKPEPASAGNSSGPGKKPNKPEAGTTTTVWYSNQVRVAEIKCYNPRYLRLKWSLAPPFVSPCQLINPNVLWGCSDGGVVSTSASH